MNQKSSTPRQMATKNSSEKKDPTSGGNRFVMYKKEAASAVQKAGLDGQEAKVVLVLNVSGSMHGIFKNGVMPRACERLLALGIRFDTSRSINVFIFDSKDYEVGELHESQFVGYVDRETIAEYRRVWGGTQYAGVMKRIENKYSPEPGLLKRFLKSPDPNPGPVYVMFVTDGDNGDKGEAEQVMGRVSKKPIFWQFVGIGNLSFRFLERLNTMPGRTIDNTNFFKLNDWDEVSDEELYQRMFGKFPTWLRSAKDQGLY